MYGICQTIGDSVEMLVRNAPHHPVGRIFASRRRRACWLRFRSARRHTVRPVLVRPPGRQPRPVRLQRVEPYRPAQGHPGTHNIAAVADPAANISAAATAATAAHKPEVTFMDDLTGQIGICRNGTTWVAKEIEWSTDSHTHHVVVAVTPDICISAEPGGVVERTNNAYTNIVWFNLPLTDEEKAAIVAAANAKKGLPYNYAIFAPLFLAKLLNTHVPALIAQWLGHRRNVDCSQLVDDVYNAAGKRLFTDGPTDIVTPGDFERLAYKLGILKGA